MKNDDLAAATWKQILAELKSNPTVSVPVAGKALANLSPAASYRAAENNTLGVEIMEIGGGKKVLGRRVRSIDVLRKLGLNAEGKPV